MVYGFFVWWYADGLVRFWQSANLLLFKIADFFSVDILLRTWVAPWKNDVLSARNISLSDQFQLWKLNFASRLIGFLVRTIVIFTALIILTSAIICFALGLSLWLILPFLSVLLPVIGTVIYLQ